jgi:hypothetical protein
VVSSGPASVQVFSLACFLFTAAPVFLKVLPDTPDN